MSSFRKGAIAHPPKPSIPFHTRATAHPPDTKIPRKVFQTWITHKMRPGMHRTLKHNQASNPEFDFFLFDDKECRNYVQENYDTAVLRAYDSLIPGAYKADLWRLCVLYKEGGVYLDIKFKILKPLREFLESDGPLFVQDDYQPLADTLAPYQAILAAPPGFALFKAGIHTIVRNVETKYYGINQLDPTGPIMMSRLINKDLFPFFQYHVKFKAGSFQSNIYKNESTSDPYFQQYDEYRLEQHQDMLMSGGGGGETYVQLWNRRAVYK